MSGVTFQLLLGLSAEVVLTFRDQDTITGASSPQTFSGMALGPVGSTKVILFEGHGSGTTSALTVDGVSATKKTEQTSDISTRSIWTVSGVMNTTGDVVVTNSAVQMSVQVYSMVGHSSDTPTATYNDGGAEPHTFSIDIPVGGAGVAASKWNAGGDVNASWSGLTEDFEAEAGTTNIFFSSAHKNSAAGDTALTVTCNWSGGVGTQGGMIGAVWGPA